MCVCTHIAHPSDRKKRPSRQIQIVGLHVVAVGRGHFVKQHDGLHRDHQQQHQGGKYVDPSFEARAGMGPQQIDGDVVAPVTGGGNAPKNQYAQKQAAEIVAVRN